MSKRTFAVGDIHGDMVALKKLMGRLPKLTKDDTVVFVGDYVDRGSDSRRVIDYVRTEYPASTPAKVVALRGNHEDGWLRVAAGGWPEFILPPTNGCLATLRSYTGDLYFDGDHPTQKEYELMAQGTFFPEEILSWMDQLPFWYEDDHAIYVHAGLVQEAGKWVHPRDVKQAPLLCWVRTMEFFRDYRGKRVVCGHTSTDHLPPELSSFTPDDPLDMWVGDSVCAIDTGCGKGGFLTAVELPALKVYESRN